MTPRGLEDVARTSGGVAVLERRFAVRVVNISASGALLESDMPVEPGVHGTVRLTTKGRSYSDHLRVTRCHAVAGGSGHFVAVEFLWLDVPLENSVRHLATHVLRGRSCELLSLEPSPA